MSTSRLQPSSVHRIRAALESIPGALRYEPEFEDIGAGQQPGVEIVLHDPTNSRTFLAPDIPITRNDPDEGLAEEPQVGFEIPPQLTDARMRDVLGERNIGELRRLHEIRGIDAFGWYVPYHQLNCQHGIFIRFEALAWLAVQFLGEVRVPLERKLELAFHAILRHELFHFEAECMISTWELATGVEVYWSSRKYRNAAGYIELEEGLANAYMLRGFKYPTRLLKDAPGAYQALKTVCEQQPAGYRDGPRYLNPKYGNYYLRECSQLSDDYHQASAAPWYVPDEFDTLKLYNDVTQIDWTRCPIIVQDQYGLQAALGIDISYFQLVVGIVETEEFRRALYKLDGTLQTRWERVKTTLATTTAGTGTDFKRWRKGGDDCYSVRVGKNFRAHLLYNRATSTWIAQKIGSHKAMGHG